MTVYWRICRCFLNRIDSCLLFYLLLTQVFTAVLAISNTNKKSERSETGGHWYDKTKWSSGSKTHPLPSEIEGSGNTDVVSDLDEVPKGLGPDDEDSDAGSGASEQEMVVEGSGAGDVKFEAFSTSTADYMTHMTVANSTAVSKPDAIPHSSPATTIAVAGIVNSSTTKSDPGLHPAILTSQEGTTQASAMLTRRPESSDYDDDDDDDDSDDGEDDDDEDEEDVDDKDVVGDENDHLGPAPTMDEFVTPATSTSTSPQPSSLDVEDVVPPVIVDELLTPTTTTSTATPTPSSDDGMYDRAPGNRRPDGQGAVAAGFDWIWNAGVFTAVIGGAVVGLLAAILLVMFVVYKMRKKDEGSYVLDEPKAPPTYPYAYQKAPAREFYA